MTKKKIKKRRIKRQTSTRKRSLALPIIGLLLNVLILPGLGSLIAGKIKEGVWQLVLAIIGIILSFFLIGIPILIAAWIWGIITGVRMIQETR